MTTAAASAPSCEQAALNNALWCASVVRAQGGGSHFGPTLWWSVEAPPRYYPRAVTLARALDAGARQRLDRLAPGDAVKDSFACLPLEGFALLFEASWYWRAPRPAAAAAEAVVHPGELADGLAAWGGGADGLASALLEEPGVTLLADFGATGVDAGCALYVGAGVVGVSNLFGAAAAQARLLDGAAAHAGPLPLVAYEQADAAGPLQAAGFRALGPLRVLLKRA